MANVILLYARTILMASLAVCPDAVRPADIVARVPSSYRMGTKWVLFRDDSVPDPPPNVILAENDVQVLPTYRHQQQRYRLQIYPATSAAPLNGEVASVHLRTTDVSAADFDKDVVESIPADLLPRQSRYDFDVGQAHDQQQQKYLSSHNLRVGCQAVTQRRYQPAVSVATYGVTAFPLADVELQRPSYVDYIRKKKNA